MKAVQYVSENETEAFSTTLATALNKIERDGFEIVSVQIIERRTGDSAYIIYELTAELS
jgi:hypothetical protein